MSQPNAFSQSGRMPGFRLTHFDRLVGLVILALIAALVIVMLLGDRVGVQIERTAPQADASSTTGIAIQFSEAMNWDSVVERMAFQPPLEGAYTWTDRTLRFRPDDPLQPGAEYTVTLAGGAESTIGRQVLDATTFDFRIRTPRVAYLAPSDATPQNVWIADPAVEGSAKQVTFSPSGVLNFDISPDGTQVAFAERNSNTGTSDIKLLNLETGDLTQLTNCPDSDCNSPSWRPDGNMLAYHRVELNSGLDALGVSPTRVWLIDLSTTPPSNYPLFSDSQILGYSPQWSADGQRIAVYDNNSVGILVYDFSDESLLVIPTRNGGSDVALSPDGSQIIFPNLIIDQGSGGARTTLDIADLENSKITPLTNAEDPIDDATTAWNPNGRYVALARRYLDDRYTRARQLYLLDTETSEIKPLVVDENYYNGFFLWDPQGNELVIQRFPENEPNGRPEIWTYNLNTEALTQVAQNAMLPRWVP